MFVHWGAPIGYVFALLAALFRSLALGIGLLFVRDFSHYNTDYEYRSGTFHPTFSLGCSSAPE